MSKVKNEQEITAAAENTSAENNAEENTSAEKTAEDTVTVSKAEFEEIKAQLALLTRKAASEDRYKSLDERRAEEEEKLLEKVRKANEEAEEEIEYYVDTGATKSNKNVEVSVNGVQYIVPKGKRVKLKRKVAEVIENSIKQRDIAFGVQDERHAEYQADRAQAPGAFAE